MGWWNEEMLGVLHYCCQSLVLGWVSILVCMSIWHIYGCTPVYCACEHACLPISPRVLARRPVFWDGLMNGQAVEVAYLRVLFKVTYSWTCVISSSNWLLEYFMGGSTLSLITKLSAQYRCLWMKGGKRQLQQNEQVLWCLKNLTH